MNEPLLLETPTSDDAPITQQTEAPVTPPAPVSIADHAKNFSPAAQKAAAAAPVEAKTGDELKPVRPVDQQKRTDTGQFSEGRHRLKAKDAVDRINQLTGRAKSAEERLAAAEAELGRLRTERAPASQVAAAERKVDKAATVAAPDNDPYPQEDDPKYAGDYGACLEDRARWAARQEYRAERQREQEASQQAKSRDAKQQTIRTFAERLTAAKAKYDDFEDTLRWDAPWLAQSGDPHPGYEALHEFILSDESGADVLQYLRSHPDEVDALLQVPPLQQVKRLSLLSQRFASSPSEAGSTGSATGRTSVVVLPHRPPNPVRTEAHNNGTAPPPTDGSLSIDEHRKAFAPKRR